MPRNLVELQIEIGELLIKMGGMSATVFLFLVKIIILDLSEDISKFLFSRYRLILLTEHYIEESALLVSLLLEYRIISSANYNILVSRFMCLPICRK